VATKVTFLLRPLNPQSYPPGGSYAPGDAQEVYGHGYMQQISADRFASVVGAVSNVGWQLVATNPDLPVLPQDTEAQWVDDAGVAHKGTVASFMRKGRLKTVTIAEVP